MTNFAIASLASALMSAASAQDLPSVVSHVDGSYSLTIGSTQSMTRPGPFLRLVPGDVDGNGREDIVILVDRGGPASEVTADVWDMYPGLPPRLLMHCSDTTSRRSDPVRDCADEFRYRHSPQSALERAADLRFYVIKEPVPADSELVYIGFPNWLNSIEYALSHSAVRLAETDRALQRITVDELDQIRADREQIVANRVVVD